MPEVDRENADHMAELQRAYGKNRLLGMRAVWVAEKGAAEFATSHMDTIHEIALYENASKDLLEWQRPKYLDEFNENELTGARELRELAAAYEADPVNQARLSRELRKSNDPKGEHYQYFADAQAWAIAQLNLTPGELHRLRQANNAYYGNAGYYGGPGDPKKWRNKPTV